MTGSLLTPEDRDALFGHLGDFAVFDAVFARLQEHALRDPNASRRFATLLRKLAPDFHTLVLEGQRERALPLPAIDTLTAMQVTIWDNWSSSGGKPKRGEKGARAERFKASIEAWTVPQGVRLGPNNRAFRGTVHLMEARGLLAKVTELENPKKTLRPFYQIDAHDHEGEDWAEYASALKTLATRLLDHRAGPIFTLAKGTHFHLGQLMLAEESGLLSRSPALEASILTPEGQVELTGWATTTSSGKALARNAILSTRLSDRRDLRKWRTANLT